MKGIGKVDDEMSVNILPSKDDKHIQRLIERLRIEEEPIIVDIVAEEHAINGDCFHNVERKVLKDGGSAVLGWAFCEGPYMVEAQFHAIWRPPQGRLIDVTPSSIPNAKQILFVIDKKRRFEGVPTDHERLNTTNNELVDDIIEFEKAKFRFTNKVEKTDASGRLIFSENEQRIWDELNYHSDILEQMYFAGCTIDSQCCDPGTSYRSCHRRMLKEFLSTI